MVRLVKIREVLIHSSGDRVEFVFDALDLSESYRDGRSQLIGPWPGLSLVTSTPFPVSQLCEALKLNYFQDLKSKIFILNEEEKQFWFEGVFEQLNQIIFTKLTPPPRDEGRGDYDTNN